MVASSQEQRDQDGTGGFESRRRLRFTGLLTLSICWPNKSNLILRGRRSIAQITRRETGIAGIWSGIYFHWRKGILMSDRVRSRRAVYGPSLFLAVAVQRAVFCFAGGALSVPSPPKYGRYYRLGQTWTDFQDLHSGEQPKSQ